MAIDFFRNCATDEERKTRYRELAKKYHSDKGGDDEIMAEINRQYNKEPESRSANDAHIPVDIGTVITQVFDAMREWARKHPPQQTQKRRRKQNQKGKSHVHQPKRRVH